MKILLVIVFIGLVQGALCQKDTIEKKKIKPCSDYISCFKYCFDSLIQSKTKLTDTVEFIILANKESKICLLKLKQYYKYYVDTKPFSGIAISHTPSRNPVKRVVSYYEIRNGIIIRVKTNFYWWNGNKQLEFTALSEKNIKHGIENSWYSNGIQQQKNIYFYGRKTDTSIVWNRFGYGISKYDYTNKKIISSPLDTIFFKNYFSMNLLSLLITEARISYEHFLFKRQSIKLEGAYKFATSNETHSLWVPSISYATSERNTINNKITTGKYISIAYIYYFKSSLSRKTLFYLSGELYSLDKRYKNKKYIKSDYKYESHPDAGITDTTYLQSEHKKIYGFKILIGVKQMLFKISNKNNFMYDIYFGFGYRNVDDLLTISGDDKDHDGQFIIYPQPIVEHSIRWKPTFNLGVKIGIAWRRK